jgi:hypothetical protein
MAHLHLLIPIENQVAVDVLRTFTLASIRLRSLPAIKAALGLGWKATFGEKIQGVPSIVVVGKIGANQIEVRQQQWIKQIQSAKKTAKILLDYTDHHLGFHSAMTNFYLSAIREVDGCIAPSKSMAHLLCQFWDGPTTIIEDPIEVDCLRPKTAANNPITLLWFGHSSNIDFLVRFLQAGFDDRDHIRLIVLSNESGLNYFSNCNLVSPAKIEFNLALWSLENMAEAAKITDLSIIPSDLKDVRKSGASSNRLITSLALGLPTAADNLPSYQEFSDYYVDLRSKKFKEILRNPLDYRNSVIKAQENLIPRFTMNKIEQDWKNFLLNSGVVN